MSENKLDGVGQLASEINTVSGAVFKMVEWAVKGNRAKAEQIEKLIDTGFTILIDTTQNVRRRLLEISYECEDGRRDRVLDHLRDIGSNSMWEQQERDMRMCRSFREFMSLMSGVFTGGIDEKNRDTIQMLLHEMIYTGEDQMADYLSNRLHKLATMEKDVQSNDISLEDLRIKIKPMIENLSALRLKLMKLEQKCRNLIKGDSIRV